MADTLVLETSASAWGFKSLLRYQSTEKNMAGKEFKIIYNITQSQNGAKSFWNRIGVAFINADGSLNCKFESFPVNGECQIRDYVPREQDQAPARTVTKKSYTKSAERDMPEEAPDGDDVPF